VKYDLEYIDRWSIWLDLRILIKTPFALLSPANKAGAY
jgi:putative colanic acid biosynthesis UDP-glucose lipid carrier transferase